MAWTGRFHCIFLDSNSGVRRMFQRHSINSLICWGKTHSTRQTRGKPRWKSNPKSQSELCLIRENHSKSVYLDPSRISNGHCFSPIATRKDGNHVEVAAAPKRCFGEPLEDQRGVHVEAPFEKRFSGNVLRLTIVVPSSNVNFTYTSTCDVVGGCSSHSTGK